MHKKKLSLKDIAKKLNVSVTTVSFVLNGKGKEMKISDEMIRKIDDYVKSVNFKPNSVAQSLRTGKTNTLVFMVEDISNPFFSKIARIIEDIAYSKGYKILFCSNENNDDRSRELINLFVKLQVEGFIITPSPGIRNDIENLCKNNIPVVLMDRYFEDLDTSYVVIDNYDAAFRATKHLINNGFKNIALITLESQQIQMINRLKGYEDTILKKGLKSNVLEIPFLDTSTPKVKDIIGRLLVENKELDAVFFTTNYLTLNGLQAIKEIGTELIHQQGIVTFDDNSFFEVHTPTITAVAQPIYKIGNELMKTILHVIKQKKEQTKKRKVVLKTELIIRDSSSNKIIV